MSRPLQSTSSPSNNILLKVTVPKWTGRKRKRGSDEPFRDAYPTTDPARAQRRSAKDLLRSLRDNVGKYQVEAVGRVDRTHVFRGKYSSIEYSNVFLTSSQECRTSFSQQQPAHLPTNFENIFSLLTVGSLVPWCLTIFNLF